VLVPRGKRRPGKHDEDVETGKVAKKMDAQGAVGVVVDVAEQIKWWDALDALHDRLGFESGLRLAHECRHPDALWFASLVPVNAGVTRERMREVMLEQGNDPRALHLAWEETPGRDLSFLVRAAEMGYAPAQALLAEKGTVDQLQWAQKAEAQGHRSATFLLGLFLDLGRAGCVKDEEQAFVKYKEAALLEHPGAQLSLGTALRKLDWERYHWWIRAATHADPFGRAVAREVIEGVRLLFPEFAKGQSGRILRIVAPVIAQNLNVAEKLVFGIFVGDAVRTFQRLLELHTEMLNRARESLRCWGIVGRRCGAVKDIRVMIGKMVWQEVWQWGENGNGDRAKWRRRAGESARVIP
jgi:hypothetical protein